MPTHHDWRPEGGRLRVHGVLALLDRLPSLRLFVHTYSGDFHTEAVTSKGTLHLSRAEYEAAHGAFPEDTLVEIGSIVRRSSEARVRH